MSFVYQAKQNLIFSKIIFQTWFKHVPAPPYLSQENKWGATFFFVYPTRRCMYCYAVNVASSVHSIGILYGTILGRSATIVGVNGCDGLESGP